VACSIVTGHDPLYVEAHARDEEDIGDYKQATKRNRPETETEEADVIRKEQATHGSWFPGYRLHVK
jgi:hypothetical protein